jgi:SAM-dependent methyltransferase
MTQRRLAVSVPTSHSLAFVREFLPASPASLLEVGAGDGELSAALAELQYSVIPIDSAPDAVSAMRKRGLNPMLASWPEYVGAPVAAVIFSRSLHHLPLDAAVNRATSLLTSSGRLIVEDFAFSEMPGAAMEWFRSLLVRLACEGIWQVPSHGFLAKVLARTDPLLPSPTDHPEIACADMIRRVLVAHGTVIHEAQSAYFYRYLQPGLPTTPAGAAVLSWALREETGAIAAGVLWPLGRRWVVQV